MATDLTEQLTVTLKAADVFSAALKTSFNINDNLRLAFVAINRYCSNGEVYKEFGA